MVGYKFMGKAHSYAYRALPIIFPNYPAPVMQIICGRNPLDLEEARTNWDWRLATTDWNDVVQRDDVDVVDICTPTDTHEAIAVAAMEQGKHVFCEKPLGLSESAARHMERVAQLTGVTHMIGFNYRFAPAVLLAKRLVEQQRLGRIYHFRAQFLQDWIVDPDFPLVWRLDRTIAGSGALGDLGSHLIDLAHFLIGDIASVTGVSKTFVSQRPLASKMAGLGGQSESSQQKGPVTVDDATVFLVQFVNGALGTFEATRFALGHRSTNFFEINGSAGSVRFDFERMNELSVYFQDDADDVQGFRRVLVTDPPHPYGGRWWPAGHGLGYDHTLVHELAEFVSAIEEGRSAHPNFTDGVKCQVVMEAVETSCQTGRWVTVDYGLSGE
ncbi:MAG: dehydrogenase [Sulfobacillus acidophilus]|uniref:Dehydrogenase n=1 Tax=Sulfobacillus acidophilus TaxID=53633 RepID=A0A2T2WJN8_9FIRM|nr:MAG: dehydrogenase [Sulfobacillus acidophilus]